jgi:abequosyltransferase
MKPICNRTLSIVIPSYNRADFLDRSLSVHVPMAQRHNVQIFISDNASTDNTQEVIEKWQKQYDFIRCSRNPSTIGPDANFEKALKAVDTQYVWLLGDTSQIPEDGITSILKLAEGPEAYSAIIVNLVNKNRIASKTYGCPDLLLTELGGLMSCMSCLIYNKALIEGADFSRYYDSFFMQTGVILEHAAGNNVLIRWEQEISITSLESSLLQKKGWAFTPKIFEIGVQSWVNFIFSLPPRYSLKSKLSACHGFGKVSGAFSIKGMLSQRARGLLSYSVYKQFKPSIRLSIDYPLLVVVLIALTPRPLLKTAADLYLRLKRNRPTEPEH